MTRFQAIIALAIVTMIIGAAIAIFAIVENADDRQVKVIERTNAEPLPKKQADSVGRPPERDQK